MIAPAALLALLAVTPAAGSPPPRVWLVAPAVASAETALALLRAELSASGFTVVERPAPGPPADAALELPPAPDAFAAVVPDLGDGHAAATIMVYGRDGPPRRHQVDLGPLPPAAEAETLQRLTTLSVRVAEVLKAHAAAAPAPAAQTPAAAAPRTPALALALDLGLTAGDAVTDAGTAFGPTISLALHHRRGPLARLTLLGPSVGRQLHGIGGSLLAVDTLGLVELGHQLGAGNPLSVIATISGGLQHTLTHARTVVPGLQGGTSSRLSPALGLGAALVFRPPGHRLSFTAGARAHHLLRRPEFRIDIEGVTRAPAVQITGWAGVRFPL